MKPEKYQAVAQIVSAIIEKKGYIPAGPRPTLPTEKAEGVNIRFEEARIYLYDANENKMALEEVIQYVSRYLG